MVNPPTLRAPAIVEELEIYREEPVPEVKDKAWSEVVPVAVREPMTAVEMVPLVAVMEDTNKVEPVPFVKVKFWREVVPVAVRVPTVEAKATKEEA